MLFRKIISLFLAISAAFGTLIPYGDAYKEGDFPIIGIDEKAEDTVRIMSFNIRGADVNGVSASRRRMPALEEILRTSPDSLGVQEATPGWMFWLRMLPQYGIVGECRDGKWRGEACPVLYNREKYKLIDHDTFWLSETPDKVSFGWDAACRRTCTWALLENKQDGTRYAHVNTHFDHVGQTAVRESANMIMAFIREKFSGIPVVLTADLNAQPGSTGYRIMTETLSDARLTAPDCTDECRSLYTYHDGKPDGDELLILDYILYGEGVTAVSYRTVTEGVNGRFVSDHFPIYADVRLCECEAGA